MRKKAKVHFKDNRLAYGLLAPSIILLILLIGYPMIYNIVISFQDVPLNPRKAAEFIGIENFVKLLTDSAFYKSIFVTVAFTALVVIISTVLGLAVAIFLNREFKGKKIVNAVVILSYVVPSISLIFVWKYMFNNTYGIINYLMTDVFHWCKEAPLWFDNPISAFILVTVFAVWKFFPYAYISFYAILQTIDKTLYEAAKIDGANWWGQFKVVTFPAIKPVLATVISLRTIWVFYMFTEVYLLKKQVDVIGVYLYDMAFATNDLGRAAGISIILFIFIFAFILGVRKKVFRSE